MTYSERSDAHLVELAQQGSASAFGVLVHRHGPTVLQAAQHDQDPIGATVATFVRAIRSLPHADLQDVEGWLLDLAAEELQVDRADVSPSDVPTAAVLIRPHRGTTPPIGTLDPDLDEVWSELAPRWPTGKLPRHLPSWAIWLGTIIVLLALAVLLPWAVLGSVGNDEPVVEELRASRVVEEPDADDESASVEEVTPEDDPAEPLPSFEFPEPPGEDESVPDPDVSVTPDPPPSPEPDPDTDPIPSADPDPGSTPEDPDGDSENPTDTDVPNDPDAPIGTEPDPNDADPDALPPDDPDPEGVSNDIGDNPVETATGGTSDPDPTDGSDT